jgi:hypothetical protein
MNAALDSWCHVRADWSFSKRIVALVSCCGMRKRCISRALEVAASNSCFVLHAFDLGGETQVLPHAAAQVDAARLGRIDTLLQVTGKARVERAERAHTALPTGGPGQHQSVCQVVRHKLNVL